MSTDPKPPHCTCGYPEMTLNNGSGHAPHCPVYQEWAERLVDPRQRHQDDDRQRHRPAFRKGKQ